VNGWISLVLYLVISPAYWAYLQVSLNDIWRQEADALPGQELPPAVEGQMPPRLDEEPRQPEQQESPPPQT
jgi:hypothetical protein